MKKKNLIKEFENVIEDSMVATLSAMEHAISSGSQDGTKRASLHQLMPLGSCTVTYLLEATKHAFQARDVRETLLLLFFSPRVYCF